MLFNRIGISIIISMNQETLLRRCWIVNLKKDVLTTYLLLFHTINHLNIIIICLWKFPWWKKVLWYFYFFWGINIIGIECINSWFCNNRRRRIARNLSIILDFEWLSSESRSGKSTLQDCIRIYQDQTLQLDILQSQIIWIYEKDS